MTREARRSFRVSTLSIENVNFALGLIADRMDEMEGRRGSPEFKADVDFNNNQLQNVAPASVSTDAAAFSQIPTFQNIWPVGAVFLSVVATDPASLLGFGSWERIGLGKMLVGVDSSDVDYDSAEKTGGAKTIDISHTHTTPDHTHPAGTVVMAGAGTTVNDGNGGGGTTGTAGSTSQNIMNPYMTVYMWKRTV